MADPSFRLDGAQIYRHALSADSVDSVIAALSHLPSDRPGLRLADVSILAGMLARNGPVGRIAAGLISAEARPVRGVLFDKSEASNWALGWHQDRTVVVRRRLDVAGYGPWSTKASLTHVAPPFHVLEGMVTLRVHLDDVDADNAPLLISPGSHLEGRVPVGRIDEVVARCGQHICLARTGDVWAYATPILHASEPAARPRRRRVLQFDYAARPLEGGLEWLGL